MKNREDWLADPLMKIDPERDIFTYLHTKKVKKEALESWKTYHFTTRLKLNGADYFLREVLGISSRTDRIGVPLLAFNLRRWYLDAFFFELMSAFEILIQELNAIYECGERVNHPHLLERLKKKLPSDLVAIINNEQNEDWFKRLKWHRNTVSHHGCTPSSNVMVYPKNQLWHSENYEDFIWYFNDSTNETVTEKTSECTVYFKKLVDLINTIWQKMKEQRF